ncbi:MAG: RNA-binding S4 domain-containing protein [Armatimonadetes bacterium]|nr:RNA-binding S4 domain-containing protein [Armatimonadota bacterium]MDE2205299.1 RNA-binding S4 domain-containing protein [Armatimonadota bacterium]
MTNNQTITIRTETITLGQLLKLAGIIGSGSDARSWLEEHPTLVNGQRDVRRGRKLRPGDRLSGLPGGVTIELSGTGAK